MERYRFLDFLSSRSLSVTTMPMQVEGVFLCSVFCSLTLLLEFERRKKSLSIEVLYCTSHKTRAMTNLQGTKFSNSLLFCYCPLLHPQSQFVLYFPISGSSTFLFFLSFHCCIHLHLFFL